MRPTRSRMLVRYPDSLTRGGGTPGGVQYFGDDQIGFERRERVGLRSIEQHGAKIGERVVVWSRDRRRGPSSGLRLPREAHHEAFFGDQSQQPRAAANLPLLSPCGPLPPSLPPPPPPP